jgi:hypothetical protein
MYWVAIAIVGWQWVASLGLTVIYLFVARPNALESWKWPFFATFALPVWLFAMALLLGKDESRRVKQLPLSE